MTKNKKVAHDGMQDIEQALTKTEQFFENNLNTVVYAVIGLVIVVLGYLGVQKFMVIPKQASAQEEIWQVQNYFNVDSFNLVLNGDGVSLGALDIIDDFGSTPAGNLAKYYAGISYLHLGEYELALEYLNKFKTDDMLIAPVAESAKGDAYVELEEYSKAVSAYKSALAMGDNSFTAPTIAIKLALVYDQLGETEKAINVLENVKADYSKSSDISAIDKTIARLNQ